MNASRRYSFLSPIQIKSEPTLYEDEAVILTLSIINEIISFSYANAFKELNDRR